MPSAKGSITVHRMRQGNGVASVTTYYLATSASSGVTASTSGWTTTVQTPTSSKKYLWSYQTTKYTDGTAESTEPHVIGTYGEKGDTGPVGIVYRVSVWQAGTEYRNDTNNTDLSERYVDICTNKSVAMYSDTELEVYMCATQHTSDATTNTLGKTGLWTSVSSLSVLRACLVLVDKIQAGCIDVDSITAEGLVVTSEGGAKVVLKSGGAHPFEIYGTDGTTLLSYIDTDGRFYISGRVVSGDADGERVVIDPDDKSLSIWGFPSDGDEAQPLTELSGKQYGFDELIPDTDQTLSLSATKSVTVSDSALSKSVTIGSLKPTSTGLMTVSFSGVNIAASMTGSGAAYIQAQIMVGGKTVKSITFAYASSASEGSFDAKVSVTANTTYAVVLKATLILASGTTGVSATVSATATGAKVATSVYSSKHFGNGMVIANASNQYFAVVMESGALRFEAKNGDHGVKLDADGPQALIGGLWCPQPRTLMCLRLYEYYSSSSSYGVQVVASKMPANYSINGITNANTGTASANAGCVYRTATGTMLLKFPTGWGSLKLGTNGFIQVTARATSASGERFASVYNLLDTQVYLMLYNEGEAKDSGYIDLELKVL